MDSDFPRVKPNLLRGGNCIPANDKALQNQDPGNAPFSEDPAPWLTSLFLKTCAARGEAGDLSPRRNLTPGQGSFVKEKEKAVSIKYKP
jgi:hypothetical protein